MSGEKEFAAFLVDPERRLILVHLNFFEDNVFLRFEVLRSERRTQHVAEKRDRAVGQLRQRFRVISGRFLRRKSVRDAAEFVEFAVDRLRVAPLGAFKNHMLEKMTDAGDFVRFVARTGSNEETERRRTSRLVDFRNNFQPVVERRRLKFHFPFPTLIPLTEDD